MRRGRRVQRRIVGDLVRQLDGACDLEAVLRATLGDERLRVGYSIGGERYVSAGGEPMTLPAGDDAHLRLTPLVHDGTVVAVVVHDRLRTSDGGLIAEVAAASALAAANARIAAELEASLAEVRRSRAELVAEGDAARRRVERDLHDGAQQRLVAAALEAQMALMEASDPELRAALERTCEELQAALAELRALARGLYPAALPERGLAAALTAYAEQTGGRLVLDAVTSGRLPAEVEECAYFCITNASAHASGRVHARAAESAGALILQVAPITLDGGDAVQLHDRVEAVGGTVAIEDDRFVATIPIAYRRR